VVCTDFVGSLRWGAVVQADVGDAARQALDGCAGELTSAITAIDQGASLALPSCDAADGAIAAAGAAPYLALIRGHLATCRQPLAQFEVDQGRGVTYGHDEAEALVNEVFACKSVIEGFANTAP
jgi:hypothetical protein